MTYRPTVRYDDKFKDYIDELFRATTLDRNQLFRIALTFLGESEESKNILRAHLKRGAALPPSLVERFPKHGLWQGSTAELVEGERDVTPEKEEDVTIEKQLNEGGTSSEPIIIDKRRAGGTNDLSRPKRETPRPQGEVRPRVYTSNGGGIKIRLGAN